MSEFEVRFPAFQFLIQPVTNFVPNALPLLRRWSE
jgi:hypothetical protein